MTEPAEADSLTYARALDELEAILAELEDETLDIDRLAARVARAAGLIRLCRARIAHTRLEVERIVADLDGAAATQGAEPPLAPPEEPG